MSQADLKRVSARSVPESQHVWIGPEDHKVVGTHLSRSRQDVGVTQVELARRLKKPQSFVSSYERGQRRIDFLEFVHIMLALGYDPAEIGAKLFEELVPYIHTVSAADPA